MLGHYQKYTLKQSNIAELNTALLSIWNDLPQEFSGKAILSFRKTLQSCVAAAGGHFEHSLNTKRATDIRHWNVCTVDKKNCAKFDSRLLNIQNATACSLEKVNFKFKTVVSIEPHEIF